MMGRLRRELLEDSDPAVGRATLALGFILLLVWFLLLYFRPEYPWANAKFLAGAVCFGLWGVADALPRRWLGVAVVLRLAALVSMVGLGAWFLVSLFS